MSETTRPSVSEETNFDLGRRWFALRVKSRCEKIVSTILQHKGFEEFLPLYTRRRRWSDRVKPVELPLFPGYVFCRLDPQYRLPLLLTPGVLHFVGVGKTPVPIDDAELASVQWAVRSELRAEPWPFLSLGQRVRLEAGPLEGLEGFLVEVRKQHRIVVSLSLLKRSVAVEIERQWVRPVTAVRGNTSVQPRPSIGVHGLLQVRLP